MSRNLDRLGSDVEKHHDSSSINQLTHENKVDLSFPQPVEMVELPTKGKFYTQNHRLHNVDSVEIRHMTAKDEEILTNKSLIQKGTALDKMIQGLIVDKTIKLENMFVGDRNALILAARITGYGSNYRTNIICPICGTRTDHEFDLREIKIKELSNDIVMADDGVFEIKLQDNNVIFTLKMLTGNDETALRFSSEKKKKHNLPESPLLDQLKAIVVSISGLNSKLEVDDYISNRLLAKHAKFIREEYARVVPNLDLKYDFECDSCGTFSRIGIPFTAEFFWPQR